jgi:hypothetical protein
MITDKGLAMLKVLDDEQKSFEKDLHGVSKQEAATMNILLDKLRG